MDNRSLSDKLLLDYLNQSDRTLNIHVQNDEDIIREGKIIAYWSGGKDGGVTTTLFHAAKRMAEIKTDKKILCLDMNLKQPELVDHIMPRSKLDNKKTVLNVDTLIPVLSKGKVTTSEIKARTLVDRDSENLWYLLGTNYPHLYGYFSGNHFDAILSGCRMLFDYTLVDLSTVVDSATLSAMKHCDQLILVMLPDISAWQNWNRWKENLLSGFKLNKKSILVLVKDHPDNELDKSTMEDFLDMDISVTLPYVSDINTAKNSYQYLWDISSSRDKVATKYLEGINKLANVQLSGELELQNESKVTLLQKTKELFSLNKLLSRGGST